MLRYIGIRLVQAVVVVWLVATLVFVITRMTPGDPFSQVGGPDVSQEFIDGLRKEAGLDLPLPRQYVHFLQNAATGDFGRSIRFREPAMNRIRATLPNTIQLAAVAFTLTLIVGLPIGILSAYNTGGFVDRFGRLFAVLGQSMPTFWVGIVMILIFSVQLGWLPTSGKGSASQFIMPAVSLAWFSLAAVTRLSRSAMLDVMERDYIKFLRVKGLPERQVLWKHALRNAAVPVITLMSLQLVAFLSGSVVVETIFAWPGLGRLLVDSVFSRDYPMIEAGTILISTMLVLMNLVVDITYAYVDPRIRYD